ncbi:MAG TPA: EI24 domain-containing protein [Rhizomicrobium sp.]|nr:EI24 domain-containing protein [Rhizomicrobium sp.]
MFASARRALSLVFDPAFFGIVLKAALLTLGLFAALFAGVMYGVSHLPPFHWHFLNVLLDILAPFLIGILFFYLGAPVAALFASLFLNEVAGAIEARDYPQGSKPHAVPAREAFAASFKAFVWLVVVNILLLPFHVFLPGIADILTFLADGWFLGRQYFDLVALRHLPLAEVDAMRRRYASAIFLGGIFISLMALIPFADLIAPVFGAALMTHAFRKFSPAATP